MDPALLARYLRQRVEMGERVLFLESLTTADLMAALRGRPPAQKAEAGTEAARTEAVTPAALPEIAAAEGSASGSGSPSGLHVLGQEASGCTRCRLHDGRRNVVFGEGNPGAELVVVGEAPGAEEDRTGRPFVGPAGKLLDLLLLSAGWNRSDVYICNVLKCRPPNNRDPKPDEVSTCSSYLKRQLELISPRVLLAVGSFAVKALLDTDASVGTLRGRVHEYQGIPLVATYHPAFLLRSRRWIPFVWEDFQLVNRIVDELA